MDNYTICKVNDDSWEIDKGVVTDPYTVLLTKRTTGWLIGNNMGNDNNHMYRDLV